MLKVVIPKDFKKMLTALGKSDRVGKSAAQKAQAACTQAQLDGDIQLPRTKHGESRLHCDKYDLGDGYRLVTQKIKSDTETNLIMLFVGSHAEVKSKICCKFSSLRLSLFSIDRSSSGVRESVRD